MIILVTTIACFTCGVIGYFVGWITTADRLDRREEAPREPVSVVTAAESDEFWEGVYAGGHARSSPRVTADGGFPALPAVTMRLPVAQAPLGELVQPGRTTDFIDRLRADTDRWMRDNLGLEDAT